LFDFSSAPTSLPRFSTFLSLSPTFLMACIWNLSSPLGGGGALF
jgi:hypothetical protein